MDDEFIAWTVIFNTSTDHFCTLRERTWTLGVSSAGAGAQRANAAANDRAPSVNPVIAPPYYNTNLNNPAYERNVPVGAARTTFTK